MKTFSIKEVYKNAWEKWKQNKNVLTISALIILVVGMIPKPENDFIISIILGVVSMILCIGWIKINLKVDRGEKTEVKELFSHYSLFWKYLGASILFGLGTFIGLVLLVIPGIYFVLRYCFTLILVVDRDLAVLEAFKESSRLTDGVKWELLGFTIVSALVALLGVIALGIGLLVAMPVIAQATVMVYKKLSQSSLTPEAPQV